MSATIESVNVGQPRRVAAVDVLSGIDKRPVAGPVEIRVPGGPKGSAGSGVVGDSVCDWRHHGGNDQAVYAYAREDLAGFEATFGIELRSGMFGENLTTTGIDVTNAVLGERWKIGAALVLQVTVPRIPCRTFAVFLDRVGWVDTFTSRGAPGAYLRVLVPGPVSPGDTLQVVERPAHGVTIGLAFRALTGGSDLFAQVLKAGDDLSDELRATAVRRLDRRAVRTDLTPPPVEGTGQALPSPPRRATP